MILSMEACPLSGFYHIDADFFYRNAFLTQETKQSSKFQSDPSSKFASQINV